MFDMRQLNIRYFEVTLSNGLRLSVEPPKLKVLKSISDMAKIDKESMKEESDVFEALAEAVSRALSKNKQGKKITVDFVLDTMNIDEMQELLKAYFTWVGEIRNSKN
ncbi:hypothetical protein KCG48_04915 [Proteiniclasticum sp. BAD-10]|uniref:Uncharacterized protein n=1 Tax=Proteiniclasticum sediminis TaxID=2804028 RepID=A0A941HPQ5_9CLOT|nr:hypothetical protein [Proteiniclasticum sediminis]MBR0575681.1 hypothetical protein [Proteiniclasticum sediminis]